jgi:hypothetical protein
MAVCKCCGCVHGCSLVRRCVCVREGGGGLGSGDEGGGGGGGEGGGDEGDGCVRAGDVHSFRWARVLRGLVLQGAG